MLVWSCAAPINPATHTALQQVRSCHDSNSEADDIPLSELVSLSAMCSSNLMCRSPQLTYCVRYPVP